MNLIKKTASNYDSWSFNFHMIQCRIKSLQLKLLFVFAQPVTPYLCVAHLWIMQLASPSTLNLNFYISWHLPWLPLLFTSRELNLEVENRFENVSFFLYRRRSLIMFAAWTRNHINKAGECVFKRKNLSEEISITKSK